MTPGTLIDGRFLLEHRAGVGGMATVYRAVDQRDGAPVALKVLHGSDEVDVERLVREAAILAELQHPGIVRYAGHGVTARGEHYLAMEWLEGEDLSTRLGRRPLLDVETLSIASQAAAALGFLHAHGAVHRDLKPGNLFLRGCEVDRVAVVDLGIAGLAGDPQKLTQTGVLLGTPGYVAPEQVLGRPSADPRSDVFSLGCVLFECFSGRPAFEGQNPLAVLAKLLLQDPPRLRDVRAGVAPRLDALLASMLAREPALRPATVAEVAAEIEAIAASGALRAGPASSPQAPLPSTLVSVDWWDVTPLPPGGPTLTRDEQRLLSVVLAGRPDAGPSTSSEEGALTAAVALHGGAVSLLAGGLVVVTLWAPGTAADRAERAALCALALRERFARLPIAVVTGRGRIVARAVEGEVVERGLRLLAATPEGGLEVDEATTAMVELGAEDEGGVASGPTPCVGRNRELSMLEAVFAGCVAERLVTAALVTGPAGSGKSHLRRALIERIRIGDPRVEVLAGRAGPLGEGASLGVLADMVRRAAGIRRGDRAPLRRARLDARLGRCLAGPTLEQVASLLGELIGASSVDPGAAGAEPAPSGGVLHAARASAARMAEAIQAAWEEWILAECGEGPVVLALEDMHRADAASLRLLESTLKGLRDLPLFVLILARPEARLDVRFTSTQRNLPVIKLGQLSARASEHLAQDLAGDALSGPVVERLVERSGGSPAVLAELVRGARLGHPDVVPPSVLGLIEARLDAESPEARRILRAASVFGERFPVAGVAALLGSAPAEVRRTLDVLSERELVVRVPPAPGSAPEPSDAGGAGTFMFRQGLVHDAAHAMLTEHDRVLGHHLARAYLERAGSPDEARPAAREEG